MMQTLIKVPDPHNPIPEATYCFDNPGVITISIHPCWVPFELFWAAEQGLDFLYSPGIAVPAIDPLDYFQRLENPRPLEELLEFEDGLMLTGDEARVATEQFVEELYFKFKGPKGSQLAQWEVAEPDKRDQLLADPEVLQTYLARETKWLGLQKKIVDLKGLSRLHHQYPVKLRLEEYLMSQIVRVFRGIDDTENTWAYLQAAIQGDRIPENVLVSVTQDHVKTLCFRVTIEADGREVYSQDHMLDKIMNAEQWIRVRRWPMPGIKLFMDGFEPIWVARGDQHTWRATFENSISIIKNNLEIQEDLDYVNRQEEKNE